MPKPNDPIVQAVIDEMTERDARGFKKYGTTTHDNPLDLRQWLQHALEETLDNAIYLRRAIKEIDDSLEGKPCSSSHIFASLTGTKSPATDSTGNLKPSTDGSPGKTTPKS